MRTHNWLSLCVWVIITWAFETIHHVESRVPLQYVNTMSIFNERLKDLISCQETCTFTLVESIPDNLTYPSGSPILMSTYAAHKRLLEKATHSVHLASFYWTLTTSDQPSPDNSSFQGGDIYQDLLSVVKGGKIDVKIAQNVTNNDTDTLAKFGAQIRTVDMLKLVHAGVLHTKMWVVDESHVYIGSGNFDWRSYTQTKELGALIENCPCLGADAEKLFQVYWYLGAANASIPEKWPDEYSTGINVSSPVQVPYNDTQGYVYLSSAPPQFCPNGRTRDLDAILNVIISARKFIYISVMDYYPMFIYTYPKRFWPVIDDALRRAAIDHHIHVCLLASQWNHTAPFMLPYLKSLYDLNSIPQLNVQFEVKLFTVPSSVIQQQIPYARVSHSKYMVTDRHAYIGTSNWSGDYFKNTGGVGFILEQPESGSNGTSLRSQLESIFKRDWNSSYAQLVA